MLFCEKEISTKWVRIQINPWLPLFLAISLDNTSYLDKVEIAIYFVNLT